MKADNIAASLHRFFLRVWHLLKAALLQKRHVNTLAGGTLTRSLLLITLRACFFVLVDHLYKALSD